MKNRVAIFITASLMASCDKPIDLKYKSIDPVYVVDSYVDGNRCEARITMTRDMTDPNKENIATTATITLTNPDGEQFNIPYTERGLYRLYNTEKFTEGEYRLDVTLDNNLFSSTSQMYAAAKPHPLIFNWLDVMGSDYLTATLSFRDSKDGESYYRYSIVVNDEEYSWGITKDNAEIDGDVLNANVMLRKVGDDILDEKPEIQDGDIIYGVVTTIDRGVYDYLFSLDLSDQTSTNPIYNFIGGCLGYFSAQATATTDLTEFSYQSVTQY